MTQTVGRSTAPTFEVHQVMVEQLLPDLGYAICHEITSLNKIKVALSPIRVRPPQANEYWLIDRTFNGWTFAATIQKSDVFTASQAGGAISLPTFCQSGLLVVKSGTGRIYNPTPRILTLEMLRASVEIAPTGSSVNTDLLMDGTSLGLPLSLLPGTNTVKLACAVSWPVDSYVSVDVTQVGSSYAGDTLTYSISAK
jgi:hypothetical protein